MPEDARTHGALAIQVRVSAPVCVCVCVCVCVHARESDGERRTHAHTLPPPHTDTHTNPHARTHAHACAYTHTRKRMHGRQKQRHTLSGRTEGGAVLLDKPSRLLGTEGRQFFNPRSDCVCVCACAPSQPPTSGHAHPRTSLLCLTHSQGVSHIHTFACSLLLEYTSQKASRARARLLPAPSPPPSLSLTHSQGAWRGKRPLCRQVSRRISRLVRPAVRACVRTCLLMRAFSLIPTWRTRRLRRCRQPKWGWGL